MQTQGVTSEGAVKTMEIQLVDYLGVLSIMRKHTQSISENALGENFFFDFNANETINIYQTIKKVFDIDGSLSPAIYGMFDWMRPQLTNELSPYPYYGVSVIDYELYRIIVPVTLPSEYVWINMAVKAEGENTSFETMFCFREVFNGPAYAYYSKSLIIGTTITPVTSSYYEGAGHLTVRQVSDLLVPNVTAWDDYQEYINPINDNRYRIISSDGTYRNILQISGTITLTSVTIGPATTINYADWANYALTLVMGSLVYRAGAGLGQVWALVNRAYNPAASTVSLSANASIFDYSEEYDATIQKLDNPLTFIVNGEYIGNRINDAVSWVQRNYPKLVKFSSTEYVAPGSLLSLPSYNAFPIFINSTALRDGSNFTIYEYEGRTR